MASSDLDVLLDMGFDSERADLAVKRSGGLQGALEWLEANQDKSIEEVRAAASTTTSTNTNADEEGPALAPGETARSLLCSDCGKKFRSTAQAEFHASKSGHENFEESTDEIAPLTEEEKKARLAELKERLREKRAQGQVEDKALQKRNEEIRRKSTKETQDAKESLERSQQIKAAEQKRREKADDIAAKAAIKAKIEADKAARKEKAERDKAVRAGVAEAVAPSPAVPSQASSSVKGEYSVARLRLTMVGNQPITKSYPVETTLFEVASEVSGEVGSEVSRFESTFPRKVFEKTDFGMTVKEAGWVPSANLVLK